MKSIIPGSISGHDVSTIKYSRIIAFCLLIGLSILVCCPVVFFISKSYTDLIWFLYGIEKKEILENNVFLKSFHGLKLISPVVFVWILFIWYDFLNDKKRRSSQLIQKVAKALLASYYGNKAFFYSLKKETRFVITTFFIILFIAILYFLLVMPIEYDELASYSFFTGQGFWMTLSNYSTTNNHIFSNLIICIFTKLPFNPEVTMRLPGVIITLACLWYFFKLCKFCFSDTISFLLLLFVISLYPFILYSFSARGYMSLNLFCVLIIYSSFKLSEDYQNIKYRIVFILSLVLGTFSMPTFIYAIFPVCIVLGVYVLKQKRKLNLLLLFKDGFISVALIFVCYSFVLAFNDLTKIMGLNNFSTKFSLSDPGTFEKIISHLKNVFAYLFDKENLLPVSCILILLSTIFYMFKEKNKSFFICILSATMFFSPFLILILQRVIPFERNWVFLIFPTALCLGFIIHNISNLIRFNFFVNFIYKYKFALHVLILSFTIFSLSRFTLKHMYINNIDFVLNDLRQKHLDPVIRNIHEIGVTNKSYEFHPADVIWNLCLKADPKRNVRVYELKDIKTQEILIIDKTEVERFKDNLNNYKLLLDLGNRINIYGRADLF